MIVHNNCSVKRMSNMRVGGIADTVIEVENRADLVEIFKKYKDIFIIGNGTNTLFSDGRITKPLVSLKKLDKISELSNGLIKAEAGVSFGKLISFMRSKNKGGLEPLSGIPGTVGGLVYMNGGAYGSEIFDNIEEAEIFDKNNGIKTLKKSEIGHSYRHTEIQDKEWVVLSVTLTSKEGFDSDRTEEVQKQRIAKQPLDMPNLGSIFKNPPGNFAAKLISEAGLQGYSIGGAQISEKHSNFIVNTGNATFEDIADLIIYIKKVVAEKFCIDLHEEIKIVK